MQTGHVPLLQTLVDALAPVLSSRGTLPPVQVDDVLVLGSRDTPPPAAPGALLLVTDPRAFDAASADVAAVVVKAGDVAALDQVRVPVLVVPDDVNWQHVVTVLTEACRSVEGDEGDLFALANSIAAAAGGAVVIEDSARRVLAHSSLPDQPIDEPRRNGILGRHVPDHAGNDESYRLVARSHGVVHLAGDDSHLPRAVVAVRAGAEVLGSIWAIPSEGFDEAGFLASARLAAVHLLRARAEQQLQRRSRSDVLRALLDGRAASDSVAARLALPTDEAFTVVAFALPREAATDPLTTDAMADLVHLQCVGTAPRSCVLVEYDVVLALVPGAGLSRAHLVELATRVVRRTAAALHVELAASIGSTVQGLQDVPASVADARAVLHLVAPGDVGVVEDLLPQVVLLQWRQMLERSPRLRLPVVDRLLEHDDKERTSYAESALAYLESDGDIAAAARAAGVHGNTFRYRLKRLEELFGLRLDDPDLRLVLWLQLRARRS